MMSPVDLTQKANAALFVETIAVEAGRSIDPAVTSDLYDADLRPYSPQNPVYENIVLAKLAPFFTRHRMAAAGQALQISEAYMSAAHILKHQYHNNLRQNDNLLFKISEKIFTLTEKVVEIDRMRKREATNYAFCGIFGVFGSALLSAGLYKRVQWMKTAGKVALLFTAMLYGYTWLLHRAEQKKVPQIYSEIGQLAEKIRYDLRFYTDEMKFQLPDQRDYQPLNKGFVDADYHPETPHEIPAVEYPIVIQQQPPAE